MSKQATISPVPPVEDADTLSARFAELADTWRKEVAFVSSMTRMVQHPAYRQIIALGTGVIPLLLSALERDPDYWFGALQELTGQNPVRPEEQGNLDKMALAWLKWGQEQGYRW